MGDTLSNGVRVATEFQAHAPVTAIAVTIPFGARHETAATAGWTHFLEHLLMREPVVDGRGCADAVEAIGGAANAYTSWEALVLHAAAPTAAADDAVRLVASAAGLPVLTDDAVGVERAVLLEELAAVGADTATIAQDAVFAGLFADDGLGVPVRGTPEALARADASSLEAFAAARLAPDGIGVSIAGGLPPERAGELLAGTRLGTLPAREGAPPPPVATVLREPPTGATCAAVYDEACAIVGGVAPGGGAPEFPAVDVLLALLGTGAGSVLYRRLRHDLGLAYDVWAAATACRDVSVWRAWAVASGDRAGELAEALPAAIAETAEAGWPAPLLADARRRAVGAATLALETAEGRALWLAEALYVWGLDDAEPARWPEALAAVRDDDLRRLASSLVGDMISVEVGPGDG